MADSTWMHCSACKRDIAYGAPHWVCSVSTCNRARTRLVFCSVACWDSHVAMLRHRDAWAVEATAPSAAEWAAHLEEEEADREGTRPQFPPPGPAPAPARRVSIEPPPATPPTGTADHDVLIVVSKVKKYIKERSGMNTSDAVAEALSDHVRAICDEAIRSAGGDGRKTVLDRDVPKAPRR